MQQLISTRGVSSVRSVLALTTEGPFALTAVEVGTLATFFSSEDEGVGYASREGFRWVHTPRGNSWEMTSLVRYDDAFVDVKETGHLEGAAGHRSLVISAREDSFLMDAVLRFVIPLEKIEHVQVGSVTVRHRRANRYHQTAMCPVVFRTRSGRTVTFTPRCSSVPPGMEPLVYVRDEQDRWVFHVRLLAVRPARTLLKGCHRLFNKPFPKWAQRFASRFPRLIARTLYLRERVSQRIPFQANGAVLVERGSSFTLEVSWAWS
jgi:hypothetical protein